MEQGVGIEEFSSSLKTIGIFNQGARIKVQELSTRNGLLSPSTLQRDVSILSFQQPREECSLALQQCHRERAFWDEFRKRFQLPHTTKRII